MKILCEITGGSRLYGLETPESDTDTRGVFINTDPGKILGLNRGDIIKKDCEDFLMFELCHFLRHLYRTNTQAIELLYAEGFSLTTPEFEKIRRNRSRLMNSTKLFASLNGYIQNERRLANGDRTGSLGGKRRNQVEKYGFSPKNFSHLLRLAYCGSVFFQTSIYPVHLPSHDIEFRNLVFSVKTEPEKHTKEDLNEISDRAVEQLQAAFHSRKEDFRFDMDFANDLCLEFYLPFLEASS
jgi:predicted nucleotidyltransferase